jgi:hypothetical protein
VKSGTDALDRGGVELASFNAMTDEEAFQMVAEHVRSVWVHSPPSHSRLSDS